MLISVFLDLPAQGTISLFDQKLQSIYLNTVPLIRPAELAGMAGNSGCVLLDARSPKEYQISHIPGASFVNYDHFSPADVSAIRKNQTIVVYCTVGYRSERIGEKLKQMGYTDVRNLYGGIIGWSNAGYPLVDNHQKPTERVHTWSKEWSAYVLKGKPYFE